MRARSAIRGCCFGVGRSIDKADSPQFRRPDDTAIGRWPVLGRDFHFDAQAAQNSPLHQVADILAIFWNLRAHRQALRRVGQLKAAAVRARQGIGGIVLAIQDNVAQIAKRAGIDGLSKQARNVRLVDEYGMTMPSTTAPDESARTSRVAKRYSKLHLGDLEFKARVTGGALRMSKPANMPSVRPIWPFRRAG